MFHKISTTLQLKIDPRMAYVCNPNGYKVMFYSGHALSSELPCRKILNYQPPRIHLDLVSYVEFCIVPFQVRDFPPQRWSF